MKDSSSQIQNKASGSRNWFLGFIISLLFVCFTASALQPVPLAWNAGQDPSVTGYAVYYGTNSGSHPTRVDAGTNVAIMINGFAEGATYYFVVTSYNSAGIESAPSNEISYIVPGLLTMSYNASSGAGPILSFPVAPGHSYEVQATADFITWTTIAQTTIEAANGLAQYQDAPADMVYQQRFYRLVMH